MNGTVTNDKTAIDPNATRGGHTPIVYHIIFPQDLERYGYAKALCGEMMRRRDRPAIGRPQHSEWVSCPLCELVRLEVEQRLIEDGDYKTLERGRLLYDD